MNDNHREENARTVLEGIIDIYEGRKDYSHMTGDIDLCGKTADEAIRIIREREKQGK